MVMQSTVSLHALLAAPMLGVVFLFSVWFLGRFSCALLRLDLALKSEEGQADASCSQISTQAVMATACKRLQRRRVWLMGENEGKGTARHARHMTITLDSCNTRYYTVY